MNTLEGICCICLDNLVNEKKCVKAICCSQHFHTSCIEKWPGTCPSCRGLWRNGLKPISPVVVYPEDFEQSPERSSIFGRIFHQNRIQNRTQTPRPVSRRRRRPYRLSFSATTVRETTIVPPRPAWTTTYTESYQNPYTRA